MKKDAKVKQIVIRFDNHSYDKIREYAETEHRSLGEFVRHTALDYIENHNKIKPALRKEADSCEKESGIGE